MSAPRTKRPALKRALAAAASKPGALVADIRQMIEVARQQVAQAVNAGLTTLYWQIGTRIRQDILKEKRAEYGAEIVATLGRQLETEFGRGFGEKNLRRMVQFAETFPDAKIVAALRRQLGWAHFKALIPMKDSLRRDFYAEMCRIEGWSTRTLQQKMDGMLYERTALSKKPDRLIRQELDKLRAEDALTPDLVLQDPYLLDFLGLKDTYSEKDLESALLREIERFLLKLGAGFTFVDRQKRITLDGDGYYIAFGNAATRLDAFVAAGGTFTYGTSPDLEGLIQEQASEMDGKKREAILHRIQQLIHDKAMVVPIWELAFLNGHGPRVAESGLTLITNHAYSAPYEDVKLKGK